MRFIEFKIAKNGNRAMLRADQIIFYGETPEGIEIAIEGMEGSIVVTGTIETVQQALEIH